MDDLKQVFSFEGKDYTVERLWEETKDFIVHECHPGRFLSQLETSRWGYVTGLDLLTHINRVMHADMSYPIILDNKGNIVDGLHRVCKAFMHRHESIMFVQYEEEIEPDG